MVHKAKKKQERHKPDWLPDAAWDQYISYNDGDQGDGEECIKKRNDLFEKIIFSEEAPDFWLKFPKDKNAGNFLRLVALWQIDSRGEREYLSESKALQKSLPKDLAKLKGDLHSAGYIKGLYHFVHQKGALKIYDKSGNLVDTNVIEVLSGLENFIKTAEIGISGAVYAPKAEALSKSRQSSAPIDFMRALHFEMVKNLGFKDDKKIRDLIANLLPLIFPEGPEDGKDWKKIVADTLRSKK